MRVVCQSAAVLVAVSLLGSFAAYGQGVSGLTVTNYQFVSEQRWSRTQSYVTYKADLVNTGLARGAMTAVVSSISPAAQTVPGQTNLHFPPVPAGGRVTSIDTFTLFIDRTVPFDINASLQWSLLAPVANAGPNQTAAVGATVTLNGSASTNPSGVGSLSYTWSFLSRPPGTTTRIQNSTNVSANFTIDIPGDYVIKLVVSNGVGTDTATVTVSTSNSPPVANAGPDRTVALNSTVTLSGSLSTDVNGDPLTYKWSFSSIPTGSAAVLATPTAVTSSFVVDKPGVYVVQLVVNDGKVDSAPAYVRISTGSSPPVANAGSNQVVNVGTTVQLDGSKSTDIDGNPITYLWSFNTLPAGSTATLSDPTAVKPTFVVDKPGTYVLQLIVKDVNASSQPATVTISTNAVQPPVANAGTGQTIKHGITVQLSGSATDPQNLPLTLQWSFTTVPQGSTAQLTNPTSANPTFLADKPGQYVVQLVANNGYLTSTPSTVTITTTNTPPVANAGQNTSVSVGSLVTLDGSGSTDADNDPLTYRWSFNSIPANSSAVLSAATSKNPTFVADVAGTYVVQLIVNDGYADSTPATVTITAGVYTITLSPSPLAVNTNSSGTLNLTLGSPTGSTPLQVNLQSSNPASVTVSNIIQIPANSSSTTINVNTLAAGTANVTATAQGYTSGVAQVNVIPPAITLATDFPNLGISKTMNGTVTLSAPAPMGGVVVSLVGSPSGVLGIPSSVTILTGTTATFTITGQSLGNATIKASSAGYASSSAQVNVGKLGAIQIGAGVTVGPNQTATLPISLAAGAPLGGATINLSSSDPTTATVPATVFIPQGATVPTTQPLITGVKFGSVNITASAAGFDGDTKPVQVTATLAFNPNLLTIGTGGDGNLTLTLSAPAPAGVTVNLSSDTPTVATVPSTVSFPTNATSVQVPVHSLINGQAVIHASNSVLADTTATVTVATLGSVNLPATPTVGVGQSTAFNVSLSSAAPLGGTTVNFSIVDPTIATIIPASVFIPAGQTAPGTQPVINGKSVGTTGITANAIGYASATRTATVNGALSFTPNTVNVTAGGTQNVTLNLSGSTLNPLTVTLTSDSKTTATVPATVVIPANSSSVTVAVTGAGIGATAIHATATGVTQGDLSVTVQSAGTISIPTNTSVALGQTATFAVSLPSAPANPVTVSLSSADTSKVTISPATVVIPAGQTTPAAQPTVTGVNLGSANITASSPNYTSATQPVKVTATLAFNPNQLNLGTGADGNLTLTISAAAPTAITVNLSSDTPAVATVPASINIPASATSVQVPVHSLTNGQTVIHASNALLADTTATVTVSTLGSINLPATPTVGVGQNTAFNVTLSAAAPQGGTTVNLVVGDPTIATIVPASVFIPAGQTAPATQPVINGISVGTTSITANAIGYGTATRTATVNGTLSFSPNTVNVTAGGSQNVTLNLSGSTLNPLTVTLASDATGTATVPATVVIPANSNSVTVAVTGAGIGATAVHATATGVTQGDLSVTVQSAGTISIPSNTSLTLGQTASFAVSLPSAPASPVTVSLSSGDTTKVTISPATVVIPAGQTSPAVQPTVTGVSLGSANITASSPNYTSATQPVKVTATLSFVPTSLTISGFVASNVQVKLPANTPVPVTVTLSSDSPSTATVPASVTIAAGTSSATFAVTGVAVGSTTIHASSLPNIPDAPLSVQVTGTITVPATASVALGASQALNVSLSSAPTQPVTVNLAPTDPTIVSITPASVVIPAGQTTPASQPQITGLSVGTTSITAQATNYTSGSTNASVTASLSFNPNAFTVGMGGTKSVAVNLSAATKNPLTVTLSSDAVGTATVPASVVIPANTSTANVTVSAVAIGTTTIRASGPTGVTPASAAVTVSSAIQLPSNVVVGPGSSVQFPVTLATGNPSGVFITLKVSDPTKATFSTTTLNFLPNATSPTAQPNLNGLDWGTVTITASALGYTDATTQATIGATLTISPSPIVLLPNSSELIGLNLSTPAPASGLDVQLSSSDTTVATVPSHIIIPSGSNGVFLNLRSLNQGTAIITASTAIATIPNATANVAVGNAGSITIPASLNLDLGPRVAQSYPVTLTGPAPQGGLVVTLQATTGDVAFIPVNCTNGTPCPTLPAGYNSTQVTIPAGATQPTTQPTITGLSAATLSVGATAPGYNPATGSVKVNASFAFNPVNNSFNQVNPTGNLLLVLSGPAAVPIFVNLSSSNPGVVSVPSTMQFFWDGSSPTTLLIQATINGPGTADITAKSTNMTDAVAHVTVVGPLSISTTSLPGAAQNTLYNTTVVAAGGTTPYTFSATGLPGGLTINASTGVISGTPTAGGTSSVTVTVTDSSPTQQSVSKQYSLTVTTPVVISNTSLPGGTAGVAYTAQVVASGGTQPYTYLATNLPSGITINASTGQITGTPSAAFTGTVTLTVNDNGGQTVSKTLNLTVVGPLTIANTSLPNGVVNGNYSVVLNASGGNPAYTWTVSGLPTGLSFNASTATISGVPQSTGSSNVVITLSDTTPLTVNKTLVLKVVPPLAIATASLPPATTGSAYTTTLAAQGGTTPYAWSAQGLPAGMNLDPNTGILSGTPGSSGTTSIAFTVTDATNPMLTATRSLNFVVNGPLTVNTTALPGGTVNAAYSATIQVGGGAVPYSFTAVNLPGGLSIDKNTGVISGTPGATGTNNVSITVSDSSVPNPQVVTKQYNIVISSVLSITTTVLPDAVVGASYSTQPVASGGASPYVWNVTGLPTGLNFNAGTGLISGTATTPGTSSVVIKVTDNNSQTATATISLRVVPALSITTTALASGVNGTSYTQAVAATGGTTPLVWSASGLPGGLSISAATGTISGTPSVTGTFNPSITLTDTSNPSQVVTKSLQIVIVNPLSITTTTLAPGAVGAAYSLTVTATGGTTPFSWSATGLPSGLTINATSGLISGTPASAGTVSVQVTVTDATNPQLSVTKTLSLAIAPPLSITTNSLPAGTVGGAYSATAAATGGNSPYIWSASGLPAPLVINSSTGVISGTPTAAGTFAVSITAKDSTSPTALTATVSNLSLVISNPPPASITKTGGDNQTAALNTAFTNQLQVTVLDSNNNPVTGAQVTFTGPATGASLVFNNSGNNVVTVQTNSLGVATTPILTANGVNGVYQVTAAVANTALSTSFTLTNGTGGPGGTITVGNVNVGQDLQTTVTVTISPVAGTGGQSVTITSTNPNLVKLGNTGASTVTTTIAEGTNSVTIGVQGFASSGSVPLTVTATNYSNGTGTVTLTPSGFVLAGPNDVGVSFPTNQFNQTTMTVYSARLTAAGAYAEKMNIRNTYTGSISVPVSSTAAGTVSPASVSFAAGDSSQIFTFRAASTGSATITAGMPTGFTALTDGKNTVLANIAPPGGTFSTPINVGQNLETTANVQFQGTAATDFIMTITSTDPKVKLSTSSVSAGSSSITLQISAGAHNSPDFYVQGFGNTGTVTLTADMTAGGFGSATGTVNLFGGGVVLASFTGAGPNPILTTPTPATNPTINVYTARLDSNGNWLEFQPLAGGLSTTVQLTSTVPTAGGPNPTSVNIGGGSGGSSTTFVPNAALATTTITQVTVNVPASPAGFATPSGTYSAVQVTVTTPKIGLQDVVIGKDLQLQAGFTLGQAAPAGLVVRITSNNPAAALVAASATAAGSTFVDIPVAAGATNGTFYLQALDASSTPTYTASASGYTSGTGNIANTPSGVVISTNIGLPFLTMSQSATSTISVFMGQLDPTTNAYTSSQALRGGFSLPVTLTTTDGTKLTVDSPVTIQGGVDPSVSTATTVLRGKSGGTGNVTVNVTQPAGYTPASNSIFFGKPTSTMRVTLN